MWYFVDKTFGHRWGWTGNGEAYPSNTPVVDSASLGREDDGGESTNASDLPTPTWPSSCQGEVAIDSDDTSAILCDYVKPPYEEGTPDDPTNPPLPDFTRPAITCDCNEFGCMSDSPACCFTQTC